MTVDLLSVRLKEAKRELTNLKTAHLRGLGMLRVYQQIYNFSDLGFADNQLKEMKLTINTSTDFPALPLIVILPQIIGTSSFGRSITIDSVNYTNNGYTMISDVWVLRRDSYGLTNFTVISTAPIVSVTLEDV